ncbi:hypothetical protein TraAM80_04183 [Trypanosoma rangeli]|uniref:Uncharacterized protein n=1 Tax=Trypanosoma rangeli TaxID=5698 RepID=A0A3S5IRD4_TRYRA|nr:uncharacterized protein TraAM80_04183 [Trypanosoma rangeli]RNF06029.1 hypothetical protein TraAM80_04183 [Trypanosoma rangeli]|eukprot:RNF06029.1 hypothetical protein TraAM80_04183 [Trypanosoma rangeli]
MDAVCDGVLCRVEVQGYVISCNPLEGEARDARGRVFTRSEITQLLRSRRDAGAVKVVVGATTLLMRFVDSRDRERFIGQLQGMEGAGGDTEQWVASTICQTAVDLGLLDEAALEALLREEFPRGVAVAFDAVGSLVDPKTFRLCPITDQLESDIFRQVPILAKIFVRRVTDEETRQRFWEAVVRKYFCFSRTFLEEEMRELEAADTVSSTLASGEESLSGINVMSGRALPKVKASAAHALTPADAPPTAGTPSLALLFCGRPTPHRRGWKYWQCELQHSLCAFKGEVAHPAPVSRVLPKESTNRETLELLRKFWRRDKLQKRALRSKLNSLKFTGGGMLQRQCVLRARAFLRQLDLEGEEETDE